MRVTLPLAALLTGLALATAPAAEARCAADPEDPPLSVGVPTLSVHVAPQQQSYHRGQRGLLRADIRIGTPDGPKAAGATIEVLVTQGTRPLAKLYGKTDEQGAAVVRFAVPRSWPTGAVVGDASAKLAAAPSYDCRAPLAYHSGRQTVDPLFRVRP